MNWFCLYKSHCLILINFFSFDFMFNFLGCITCWCPCVTFGRIAEIVDKGSTCKKLLIFYNKLIQLSAHTHTHTCRLYLWLIGNICESEFEAIANLIDLQHVGRVGLCTRWCVAWLGVVAYTRASTAPRWDDSTRWRRALVGIAWFIAVASNAPCAKNIVNFTTVDLTWSLVCI